MNDDPTFETPEREAAQDGALGPRPARVPLRAAAGTPQLRTVAVCDIADSTALVERLGDRRAAELFRRHDRLARDLLHRHQGREIDKTDGFLALFDRPIHAVAFALDYQRGLRDLGAEERLTLTARVGIHVGDVVLWENAAEDIAQGAKRVEVEGLAKPVAARLMQLARPGQILLSGMAHNLAQRSQAELGLLAARVRWHTHGRYRFKGVPAPMLVHEVGELDIAPLKPPPSSSKAQRELPAWRRPKALLVEGAVALLGVVALVAALSTRPTPAIAFGERDWVVMGDLRNLTGDPGLGEAMEAAFRISLEQSRFVNIHSDLAVRAALERMQRPPDTAVDREVAAEIALREGARAVILPTIADVGGRYRVSAEVIDPNTQTTVYAESADGHGPESSLASLDQVAARLRHGLGESLQAIRQDANPLPRITGGNLEALRAYAGAVNAHEGRDFAQAAVGYARALEIDPQFALAHIGLARLAYTGDDYRTVQQHLGSALAHRDRLTARDALYLEAWQHALDAPVTSMEKWRLLGQMYPDYHAAAYNFGLLAWESAHAYDEALRVLEQADSGENPRRHAVGYLRATLLAVQDRLDESAALFDRGDVRSTKGRALSHAALHLARSDPEAAEQVYSRGRDLGQAGADAWRLVVPALIAVESGELPVARERLGHAAARIASAVPGLQAHTELMRLGLDLALGGVDPAALRAAAATARAALAADEAGMLRRHAMDAAVAAYFLARNGNVADATALARQLRESVTTRELPAVAQLLAAVDAYALSRAGDGRGASALVATQLDGSELYQLRVALLDAQVAADDLEAAAETAQWLEAHRGRALLEYGGAYVLTFANALDLKTAPLRAAEISVRAGKLQEARAQLARFRTGWLGAADHPGIAARVAAIEAAVASDDTGA